tara:strand:- start:160 stop:1176 length:1017 start_codon:yes stop_codon:yes gene_type:complete
MKKILIISISLLIFNSAIATPIKSPLFKLSKYFKNGKLIKIQSYTAKNFMEIKDGTYKKSSTEIDAFISYPKKGDGPFPVVMFVHSSGGPLLFTDKWFQFNRKVAKSLNKKFVIMFIDNFAPRGTYTTYANQQKVSHWSTYIDAFKALEYLSKDSKINIKKVGITGWSRGGMISLMVGEKRLRDILVSKNLYFAAAQPRSPDCTSMMFRNPQPIKETKTWMVLGEADDYTLAEDCVEQGKKIKAKGGDIEITVKKGWKHGFTANYEAEYEPEPMIFHNCPDSLTEDDGTVGTSDPNYKWLKEWWNDPCIKYGATIGGTNKSWEKFRSPFLKFFKKNLL